MKRIIRIGCEESGRVRDAMIAIGLDAESCDILPTRSPGPHHQGDIIRYLESFKDGSIDLLILHPDCTALSLSGNRWYGVGMPMHHKRIEAIEWTVKLWELAKRKAKRVCLENPTSVIFKHLYGAIVQYIQPHQFGHGETKKTGLAKYNLPDLIPTNEVEGREPRIWKMAPGPNRKRDRSETFKGVADAFADQWGRL